MEAAGATRRPWACPEGRGPGAARHEGGGGAPGGRTQCPPPAAAPRTHLLLRQVQELSLGLLHVRGGAPDDDRVAARALHGEVDVDPATLLHDGADQAALRADEGVVQLGRDRDLRLGYVGLESHAARGSHVCVWPGRASAQGPGPWAGGQAGTRAAQDGGRGLRPRPVLRAFAPCGAGSRGPSEGAGQPLPLKPCAPRLRL